MTEGRTRPGFATHDVRRWTGRDGKADARGSNHRNSKLTEADVRELRSLPRFGPGTAPLKVLAEKYGVSPRTVRNAIDGVTWTHVHVPGWRPASLGPDDEEEL